MKKEEGSGRRLCGSLNEGEDLVVAFDGDACGLAGSQPVGQSKVLANVVVVYLEASQDG